MSGSAGSGGSPPAPQLDGGQGGDERIDAGVQCKNLECQQVPCPGGGTTTVRGVVVAPTLPQYGAPDPLYNALVYIPNGPVEAIKPGVSCDKCGVPVSGSPIVLGLTDTSGKFTLTNVPAGTNIPLVIQIGRWRRQVLIPKVTACADNPLPADLTRLPRNKAEGDIPLIAVASSYYDAEECILRKIGIDDAELTAPSWISRFRRAKRSPRGYRTSAPRRPSGTSTSTTRGTPWTP